MGSDGVPGVSLQEAGKAVAFYWGGAMVGRAIGSILLARVSAARLLALSTAIAAMLCLYVVTVGGATAGFVRSEEHTSELQSLMRISYAVFCLKKKKNEREKLRAVVSEKYN